jgi:RNA polymerase sigma-70 factor (sigma-E family)
MELVGVTAWTPDRAAAAHADDFDASFDALYVAAYRAAFRLLGSRPDAEDAAQEACARACVRWRKVQRLDAPVAWVVRVATNIAIDRWRQLQRDAARAVDAPTEVPALDGRRVDLHRALESLPKRQRDVVVLRYVVDLSEAETAEALGCAPGTVKSHASRGIAALRAALGEEDDR